MNTKMTRINIKNKSLKKSTKNGRVSISNKLLIFKSYQTQKNI
jgi:hypothetical protein